MSLYVFKARQFRHTVRFTQLDTISGLFSQQFWIIDDGSIRHSTLIQTVQDVKDSPAVIFSKYYPPLRVIVGEES